MNLILIDADCKNLFLDENQVKMLLEDDKPEVLYLDISTEFIEHQCKLSLYTDITQFRRCVLLTAFSGGIQKYHQMLIENNGFAYWAISVLDVQHQSYKQQYVSQLDTMLADSRILYRVLFDNSECLEKTARECMRQISGKKVCLIAGRNQALMKSVHGLFAKRIPNWEILLRTDLTEEADYVNAVIVIGSREDDFLFCPLKSGIHKVYFWFEQNSIGESAKQYWDAVKRAGKALSDLGWNLYEKPNIFCSSLEYENFCLQLENGTISTMALKSDEKFVMWDEFGLPVGSDEYSEENIRDFLKRHSSFFQLAQLI